MPVGLGDFTFPDHLLQNLGCNTTLSRGLRDRSFLRSSVQQLPTVLLKKLTADVLQDATDEEGTKAIHDPIDGKAFEF